MKLTYKLNDKASIEVEGDGQKSLFKELASVQEIFGENNCGMCGKNNLKYLVRTVEGNDYFELRCADCGAVLSFGQHKKGGTLFPKRKDESGWLKNKGWHKWQPEDK